MENSGIRLAIMILLLHVLLLLIFSAPVHCDDEEDRLIQGINSFRQASNVQDLAKHDKANCVADQVADRLEDRRCGTNTSQLQMLGEYPDILSRCNVDINTTREGVILPVCVPHRVATLVLTNYTESQNSRYFNDSRYTGVGVGTEDDWTVLVLTTNTTGGSFASGATYAAANYCYMVILVPLLLLVLPQELMLW